MVEYECIPDWRRNGHLDCSSWGLSAGTEIRIAGLVASKSGAGAAGTVVGVPLSLGINGDQILAYRGTNAAPTFISAIHMNVYTIANGDPVNTTAAAWDGTANSTFASALPTGLFTGVNAIWIGTQEILILNLIIQDMVIAFPCCGRLNCRASSSVEQ
jgi:hypothetical protein